jgi:hypothetical protein
MAKKRKSLSAVTAPPETSEETMNAILKAVGSAGSSLAPDKDGEEKGHAKAEKKKRVASKVEIPEPSSSLKKERGRPATVNVPLAHLGQRIDQALFDEMRVFVAKQKIVERGYSIRTFLEEAIRTKLKKSEPRNQE